MLFEPDDSRNAESRTRMISFRVTAEEFERFRHVCVLKGLRNVSEVLRVAVNQLLTEDTASIGAVEYNVNDRLNLLESRLTYLESRLMSNHSLPSSPRLHSNSQ